MFNFMRGIGEFLYNRRRAPILNRLRRPRLQFELLEDRLAPATLNFLGSSSNWSDPNNWTGGAIPTSADDLVFDNASQLNVVNLEVNDAGVQVHSITFRTGFTLTIAGDLTTETFQLHGGAIAGAGTLYISNSLTWTAGAMGGAGITSIIPGAVANIAQTATSATSSALADTRTFVNLGTTTWNGPFSVASGALVNNPGAFTLANADFTWDAAARLQNTGTLTFDHCNVVFSGPLTLNSDVNVLNGYDPQGKTVTINGNVSIRNFTLQADLTGAGNLTVTGTFAWDHGKLSGTGSTVVPPGGTLDLPTIEGFRKLNGRTLTVQGQRTWVVQAVTGALPPGARLLPGGLLPGFSTIYAWTDNYTTDHPDTPFDNKSVKGQSVPTAPAPFNPIAAAGELSRAMLGGVFGTGSEEDQIFRAMEGIRSQADVNDVAGVYTTMNPGRNLYSDLADELSGDDWLRAQALYAVNWNSYVAVTMHQAMYAWALTVDVDLMVRVLRDSRSVPAQVRSLYSSAYYNPATSTFADLDADLQAKLTPVEYTRVSAVLSGNTADADAAAIRCLVVSPSTYVFNIRAEQVLAIIGNQTPAQIAAIRQRYSQLYGGPFVDAMDQDLQSNMSPLEWDYLRALLNGDKVLAAARRLRQAADGVGTDEDMFWNALDGLYADERAMVAQIYRQDYGETLANEIHDEFSDNMFDGPERTKTFKLYSHGGLTLAERVFYAVSGLGTDEAALQGALTEIRNLTPNQVNDLRQQYYATCGGGLDEAILGDLSGREDFEAGVDLLGRPTTGAEIIDRVERRRTYERGGALTLGSTIISNIHTFGLYSSSFNPLHQHSVNYENTAQAAVDYYEQNKDANGNLTPAQLVQLQRLTQIADQSLQTYREARAATADLAANTLATAAGIAVVIASGGTATPLVVALAAGVGGATQALTRMGLNGEFNWEQLPADFVLGAVNAGTAVLSMPANVNGGVTMGVLRRIGGSAFGGGALGGGLPVVMNENTWQEGFAVGTLRVAQAATISGFASTALPTTIGAGVIAARRALPLVRWVTTNTGTVASNIFDPAWVRTGVAAIRANTKTIQQYLADTLTGWANKVDEIAVVIRAWAASDPESVLRQRITTILDATGWGENRWRLQLEMAVDFANSERPNLASLSNAAITQGIESRSQVHMMSMVDAVDALKTRVGITDDAVGNSLATRLAALQNADNAAIKIEMESVLGAANVTPEKVQRVRNLVAPQGIPNARRLTQAEQATAARLQQQRNVLLRESLHDGAEYIDEFGKTYDQMGNPRASQFWNETEFLSAIDDHLHKSNNFTVIDLTGFTDAQITAVRNYIGTLAPTAQAKIIRIGF